MIPKVTVIIPTYKRSDMLIRTVDSVLNQSFTAVEVIVVDDNNPETNYRKETERRMKVYDTDSRVLYIKHSKNKNGSAARNTGLQYAKGKYVCFLDDDDYFTISKVEKQFEFLEEHSDYDAVCCDYKKNGKNIIIPSKENYTRDILLLNDTPQTSGIMFRKCAIDSIGGFDESYIRHQDFELLLRYFDAGYKMGKINEILYLRDVSEISNIPNGKKFESVKKKFLAQFDYIIERIDGEEPGFKRSVYSIQYERVLKNYLKDKKIIKALEFMLKAIFISPRTFVNEVKKEVLIRWK